MLPPANQFSFSFLLGGCHDFPPALAASLWRKPQADLAPLGWAIRAALTTLTPVRLPWGCGSGRSWHSEPFLLPRLLLFLFLAWLGPPWGLVAENSRRRLLRPALHSHHGPQSATWAGRLGWQRGSGWAGRQRSYRWVGGEGEKKKENNLTPPVWNLNCAVLSQLVLTHVEKKSRVTTGIWFGLWIF